MRDMNELIEYSPAEKEVAHQIARSRAEEYIQKKGMEEGKKDRTFGIMFENVLLNKHLKWETKINLLAQMLKYQLYGEKEKVKDIYYKLFDHNDDETFSGES